MMQFTIVVCGGREYRKWRRIETVLDFLTEQYSITMVLTGACDGADLIGERWARAKQINYCGIPAKWNKYDRSAGAYRNLVLARSLQNERKNGKGVFVVAFPGNDGTANMVKAAKAQGIDVIEVKDEDNRDSIRSRLPSFDNGPSTDSTAEQG